MDNPKTPDSSPEELPPPLVQDEVLVKRLLDSNPKLTYDQAVELLKDAGAL